jgi:hydroxymethylbilane synthase
LLLHRPDLNVIELRGNVPTRLQKLVENPRLDAIVLAAAGLARLNFEISSDGHMHGGGVPDALLAVKLEPDIMLPCVGQGAIGIEIREQDERIEAICARLNHEPTWHSVQAERAFLRGMGGGCQAPVGAHAEVVGHALHLRAISFLGDKVRRAEASRPANEAMELGQQIAAELKN